MNKIIYLALFFAKLCFLDTFEPDEVVLSLTINQAITPNTASYINDAIKHAKNENMSAVLIKLDTPGGLLSATKDIVSSILNSPVPIIVYVWPEGARAASAGLFIVLSASVSAMAPSTNIGAAHPVSLFGKDIEGDMKKKSENDTAAFAKGLAQRRGKNTLWVEKAVIESKSITSNDALKQNVIDIIAKDEKDLLSKIDGYPVNVNNTNKILNIKNAKIIEFPMSTSQKIIQFLSDPNLVYILFLLGLLGIFTEFQIPGVILPGLFGAISLIIVFLVQVLPINWFGALLIFIAAILFIVEIFVTSFGLLLIAGLISLIFGSYLLFDVEGSGFFVQPVIIWIFSALLAALFVLIGYLLFRARKNSLKSNVYGLVGVHALVAEKISKSKPGSIKLQGSFWKAYADTEIEKGEKVKVIKVETTHVFVTRI